MCFVVTAPVFRITAYAARQTYNTLYDAHRAYTLTVAYRVLQHATAVSLSLSI